MNASTCSGVVAFSSESIGRSWRTGAWRTAVAPTVSSGLGSGGRSGCSGRRGGSLSPRLVVLEVCDLRGAGVVRVAMAGDRGGELGDAGCGIGGSGHGRGDRRSEAE